MCRMVSFGVEDFVKRYAALKPSQFVDVVALSGDKADNIPGSLLLLLFPMMHASSSNWSHFSSFSNSLHPLIKKELSVRNILCAVLVCLLHEPELLSFLIIIDEKQGDIILFCTMHLSDMNLSLLEPIDREMIMMWLEALYFAGVEGIGDVNAVKLITKFGMFLIFFTKKLHLKTNIKSWLISLRCVCCSRV